MSKVSAMQAMREARYAAARTPRPAAPISPSTPRPVRSAEPADREPSPLPDALDPVGAAELLSPASVGVVADQSGSAEQAGSAQLADSAEEEVAEALCGHRSMNNRSCRRPAGHPEKNHRYN
jgi:hypothetical protein